MLDIKLLFLSIFIFLLAHVIYGYKWKILLGKDYFFFPVLKLNFISLYYSIVLPGQVAGDAVKAYKLGKGSEGKKRIAVSVVVDRISGLAGLVLTGLVGVIVSDSEISDLFLFPILIFSTVFFAIVYTISFRFTETLYTKLFDPIGERFPKLQKITHLVRDLISEYRLFLKDNKLFFLSVILGIFYQVLAVFMVYLPAQAMGMDISIWDWFWIFAMISILLVIPITIAGLGLREGGFIGLLALFSIPSQDALALSLFVFAIQLIGAGIGGFLELKDQLSRSKY